MAYADLHRHLDGSLRSSTVDDLARELGLVVPSPLGFSPGMGIEAALACFQFSLSLLQRPAAVTRVAAEMCEDALAEGVTTLEIRFAPQLHGGSMEAVIDAALAGIDGRAGLILCGLYGEPPATLARLVAAAANRQGVVGVDLAGAPLAEHSWGLVDYQPAFRRAAELGLGRTVHAAEGRSPEEIRVAVETLGAQRIGHGTTLMDERGVLDLVRRSGVTIEACVTSNLHTGAVAAIAEHPLPRWIDQGVRVCVCTDNTLFSAVSAPEEYERVAAIPGMTPEHLEQARENGHRAAFRR
jgi:adenosine deaminase